MPEEALVIVKNNSNSIHEKKDLEISKELHLKEFYLFLNNFNIFQRFYSIEPIV